MADINPIVSALTQYVNQEHRPLLRKMILGGDSISRMRKQLGVVEQATINLMNNKPGYGDGKVCGFDGNGVTEFTQRKLVAGIVKSEAEWCEKNLWGTYLENQYRVQADPQSMPFEEEICEDLVNGIKDDMEVAVWQAVSGDTGTSINQFDGLLTILADETASTTNVDIATGTSAYDAIVEVFKAIPEVVLKRNDVEILVAPELYRQFALELVAKNLYHYDPANGAATDESYLLPGTNVRVRKVNGLAGTKKIIATYWDNIVFGCDLLGEEEKFRLWFDETDEMFRFRALWNAAVNVAFPEYVTIGTIAE